MTARPSRKKPSRGTRGDCEPLRMRAVGGSDPPFDGWRVPGLDYPSFRLTLVAKLLNRLTAQYLAQASKLSFAEWRVLCRLAMSDGTTVRDLAEKAWVDRAEVSRAASALERSGFAARRSNPADERMPILFATKAGKALYKTLIAGRSQFHGAVVADLDEEERLILDKALAKMMSRLLVMAKQS